MTRWGIVVGRGVKFGWGGRWEWDGRGGPAFRVGARVLVRDQKVGSAAKTVA